MKFDKESKSEDFFCLGGDGEGFSNQKQYSLIFCAHALYKFQVSVSSGSLVLTQTKGLTDR